MRGSIMKLCSAEQHKKILKDFPDNKLAAEHYKTVIFEEVSAQNVAYWRKIYIDHNGKKAATDRDIRSHRKLREVKKTDDIGKSPNLNRVFKAILVIPDQHAPYSHPDLIPFLKAVKEKYKIDLVVNLGDEADGHALSFHESDPDLDSAGVELEKAKVQLAQLHDLFPQMLVCESNHGSLLYRKAKVSGIPAAMLKSYRECLFPQHGAPQWSWSFKWVVQTPLGDVMFQHMASNPLIEAAHNRCSLVSGHFHSKFEILYAASSDYLYWGMTAGCLVDMDSLAYDYGKTVPKRPIIGCAMILNGRPLLIPMSLSDGGRWDGSL